MVFLARSTVSSVEFLILDPGTLLRMRRVAAQEITPGMDSNWEAKAWRLIDAGQFGLLQMASLVGSHRCSQDKSVLLGQQAHVGNEVSLQKVLGFGS